MRRAAVFVMVFCATLVGRPQEVSNSGVSWPDTEAVVRVLTEPDEGPAGSTVRWDQPVVSARFDLGRYPRWYVADGKRLLRWIAEVTGVRVVVVEAGPADLAVVAGPGSGATVEVHSSAGTITGAVVTVGCCRVRALREDLMQAFGPLGDHAAAPSLFSNDLTSSTPAAFDEWALRILYSLPPGARAAEVRRRAELSISVRSPAPTGGDTSTCPP